MNRLQKHIAHLIISHDCVIIPGIGAILAHREPASFGADGALLSAPVRAFTFNPVLNHNDGLLVSSVARAEGLSYEAAAQQVESATAQMRVSLDEQSSLSLGAVGALLRNNDGSLRFVPGDCAELSPATMWLPIVDLSVFAMQKSEEGFREEVIRRKAAPRRALSRIAKIAATFALIIAVGLTLMTPLKVENPQLASLSIDNFTPEANKSMLDIPGTASAPVVLVLERHADAVTVVDTTSYSRHHRSYADMPAMNYCLVVASLASENEALRFVERCNDENLGILAKDGRYRVYAVQGVTVADVTAQARACGIDKRYPDAWVCRK